MLKLAKNGQIYNKKYVKLVDAPLKINIFEPKNEALVQMIFLSKHVIFTFSGAIGLKHLQSWQS